MIINSKNNSSILNLPYRAKIENNGVVFNNGLIFLAQKPSIVPSFEQSCYFGRPSNIDEIFSFSPGDLFYLKINIIDPKKTTIVKNPKILEGDILSNYRYIKICEIRGDNSIQQFLTQNPIIDDPNLPEKTFQIVRTGENLYRINGGWIMCLYSGLCLFIDEYEFEADEDFQNGVGRSIYLQINFDVSGEDVNEANTFQSYKRFKSSILRSAKILDNSSPLTNEDRLSVAPKIKVNSVQSGSTFILLSHEGSGIKYVSVGPFISYGGFISESSFPDSQPIYLIPPEEIDEDTPPTFYNRINGDGSKNLSQQEQWEILKDPENSELARPIDITALITTTIHILQ